MFAIIDIETTGGKQNDRITEIAIFIHNGIKIIDEYSTLINPETPINWFVQKLTGINNEMVSNAPRFCEVAKKIVEITASCTIVAHNATFDYFFIKNEFKSLGYNYQRKYLCTVKLSRRLIPGLNSYGLDNLCKELNIQIENRHRAAGDALATVKVFEQLLQVCGDSKNLFSGISLSLLSRLNPELDRQKIDDLPEETGVYYFYNQRKELIYVGKSTNIYSRVMSHFTNNSQRAVSMQEKVADIGYELTGSEIIALLLESEEIKKNTPVFNRAQRRSVFAYGLFKNYDENGYLTLHIGKTNSKDLPITTFYSQAQGRVIIESLVEEYHLCQKLCGLYKSQGACFHHSIGECTGACVGDESPDIYNNRVMDAIKRYSYVENDFFIIDVGRQHGEKAVVKIEKGKYIGWGYTSTDANDNDLVALHECIRPAADNREVQQIIQLYLRRNKIEKIIQF